MSSTQQSKSQLLTKYSSIKPFENVRKLSSDGVYSSLTFSSSTASRMTVAELLTNRSLLQACHFNPFSSPTNTSPQVYLVPQSPPSLSSPYQVPAAKAS